jgi:predicted DNA-binding transcriptional regulator AlpA
VSDSKSEYISRPAVARRYERSIQSIWRWENDPTMNFPKGIRIRGRVLFKLAELEAWERQLAAAA